MESMVKILGAFLDTLVLNIYPTDHAFELEERRLDPQLREELTLLKEQAQEIEEDFREAELSAFLRDDHVRGERALEAAPQSIALHERNAGQRRAEEALAARPLHVDAELRVLRQRLAIARLDDELEEREIAAEVEHAGRARTGDVVIDFAHLAFELDAAAVGDELRVVRAHRL